MYKKILFVFLVIILLSSMFCCRRYFNILYFQNDLNAIAMNLEAQENGTVYACFNKNCDVMEYDNGVYSYRLNNTKPIFYEDIVDNIEIISNKPLKYNSISLFVSKDFQYFDSLEQNEIEFNSETAYSINVPLKDNNKTFIQKVGIYFESIFYNWYFYIIFYILALIFIFKYKPKIRLNIFLILILAIVLRLSHIDFVSLWNDELYTFCHISDMGSGLNLKNTLTDPGNPPLFFIISNIWLMFFKKNVLLIRFLPLIIGLFEVYSIYFVLNKLLNKKTALIASFLSSINIYFILESNEIRSYILAMTLMIWGVYFFFKLKKDFSNKNIVLYTIITILLINTHYYCVLYVLFNFISGMFLFKNKIKFLISNCIAVCVFLPCFILNRHALSDDFNAWITSPSVSVINNHVIFYFGNIIFFAITVIFCIFIYKKLKQKEKTIFIYTILAISFSFIAAFVISVLIKPILFERYFCIFLPFLIINTAIFLSLKLNPILLVTIFLFSINMPKYEVFNYVFNANFAANYYLKDKDNYKDYTSYFIIPDNIDYIKYFPQITKPEAIVSSVCIKKDLDSVKFYLSKIPQKNKLVLYIPKSCLNYNVEFLKNLDIKKIETTYAPIYKIVIK